MKAGDTIFGGQVLGEVQSDNRIIEVTLNEEDFAGINEGQKVGVTIFSFGNKIFEGVVSRLTANVDPATGRRKLFVKLTSNENLPVGSSGRAEIIKREIKIPPLFRGRLYWVLQCLLYKTEKYHKKK